MRYDNFRLNKKRGACCIWMNLKKALTSSEKSSKSVFIRYRKKEQNLSNEAFTKDLKNVNESKKRNYS